MAIEVKDTIGTVTVTVDYNASTEKPEVGCDVDVQSEVFPVDTSLQLLASGLRRAADELDKQREAMRSGG
jgi:hypothetical protein